MNNNDKIPSGNLPSRRKFIWNIGIFSVLAAVAASVKLPFSKIKNSNSESPENKIITMLTQDGKLVQVNEAQINSCRRKVNNHELQNWIKK